jgi:hypothetical protein
MATVSDIKVLVDSFGVAVRAGMLTPTIEDEKYLRTILDLPEMTAEARAAWAETNNVRKPVTLKDEPSDEAAPVKVDE